MTTSTSSRKRRPRGTGPSTHPQTFRFSPGATLVLERAGNKTAWEIVSCCSLLCSFVIIVQFYVHLLLLFNFMFTCYTAFSWNLLDLPF